MSSDRHLSAVPDRANPDREGTESMWVWFGIPADPAQPEHVLMVVTADMNGMAYRPLMAMTRDHAEQLAVHAQGCADHLGVVAILREFACTWVGNALNPEPAP